MPLARFVIALALRAVLGLAGLALMIYGGVYVFGSLFMLTQMWSGLQQTDSLPPVSFLLQHYGLYGGLTAVGIGMIVVAIRGAIARIQAGLPTEEEGVGNTPASRLLNIVLYGAGFLFGAFSIAVSIVPGTQMAMLVANGITVQGKVLSYDATEDPQVWNMRYQFRTKRGEIVFDAMPTEPVKEKPSMNLYANGFDVTYLESDPSQHAITQFYSHSSFVFFIVTRLLVALVGFWGLLKNISPTPKASDLPPPDEERFVPAPSPSPSRMQAAVAAPGGRRTSFGKRSV